MPNFGAGNAKDKFTYILLRRESWTKGLIYLSIFER